MEFSKGKGWILHWDPGTPDYVDRLGNEILESRAVEMDLGVLVDGKLNLRQHCPGAQSANHVLGASGPALPARQGKGFSCSALHWGSLTFSAGGSFGNHNI